MNINFKFHTYYTCRICKCIEHVPTTFFVNNLNCPILNTTIELVYLTRYQSAIIICVISSSLIDDLSWVEIEQKKIDNSLELE